MDRRWANRQGHPAADRPPPCWQKWARRLTGAGAATVTLAPPSVSGAGHDIRAGGRTDENPPLAPRPQSAASGDSGSEAGGTHEHRSGEARRMENASDSSLTRLARQGSVVACDALIRRYQDRVYTIASSYVHDPHEALEITQETFLQLVEGLAQYREQTSFYSWLCRIVVDRCIDRDRRRRPLPSLQEMASERAVDRMETRPERYAEVVASAPDLRAQLRAAIAAVPETDRMVVILADIEGLSSAEIAPILGCPVETVKTRLQRARRVIRQRLSDHLKDDPS